MVKHDINYPLSHDDVRRHMKDEPGRVFKKRAYQFNAMNDLNIHTLKDGSIRYSSKHS